MSDRLIVLVALSLALAVLPIAGAGAAASPADTTAADASPALQESTNVSMVVSTGPVEPGENVTVLVRAFNEDQEANLTDATVSLRDLPDGWEVVDQEPTRDGSYDAEAVTWSWDRVPPREYATVSITLSAPEDVGDAQPRVVVESAGDVVASEQLDLSPETTTTTEDTAMTTTSAATTTVVDDPSPTPGFGAALALVAIVAGALLATRRR